MPQRKTKSSKKKKTTKRNRTKKQGGIIPFAPLLAGLAGSLIPNLLGIGRGMTLPGTRRY